MSSKSYAAKIQKGVWVAVSMKTNIEDKRKSGNSAVSFKREDETVVRHPLRVMKVGSPRLKGSFRDITGTKIRGNIGGKVRVKVRFPLRPSRNFYSYFPSPK